MSGLHTASTLEGEQEIRLFGCQEEEEGRREKDLRKRARLAEGSWTHIAVQQPHRT